MSLFHRHRFAALVATMLAAICAVPTVASAAKMEVAMQDDLTILNQYSNRALLLQQFKAMGGTHVRIMFEHKRAGNKDVSPAGLEEAVASYDGAVNAVVAAGLQPQGTLFWRGEASLKRGVSPKLWSAWAQNIAARYKGKVNRWSIGNEPDLYEVEAKACSTKVKKQFANQFKKDKVGSRMKTATEGKTVPLIDACNRYQRGVTYHKIFNPAAKGVLKGNSGAEVLAGETSPNRSLDWFFRSAKPGSLKADGWAHHPFQFKNLNPKKPANNWGIGNYKLLKKQIKGLPMYFTEFGYPRPGSGFDQQTFGRTLSQEEVAKALVDAWKFAKKIGAKQMLQYQWFQKPAFRQEDWDTGILNADDGTSTPSYDALKAFVSTL